MTIVKCVLLLELVYILAARDRTPVFSVRAHRASSYCGCLGWARSHLTPAPTPSSSPGTTVPSPRPRPLAWKLVALHPAGQVVFPWDNSVRGLGWCRWCRHRCGTVGVVSVVVTVVTIIKSDVGVTVESQLRGDSPDGGGEDW
jgi:hypothetical protein